MKVFLDKHSQTQIHIHIHIQFMNVLSLATIIFIKRNMKKTTPKGPVIIKKLKWGYQINFSGLNYVANG